MFGIVMLTEILANLIMFLFKKIFVQMKMINMTFHVACVIHIYNREKTDVNYQKC